MKKIAERYPFFLLLLPVFVVIHLEKEVQGVIRYDFIYDRIIFLFAIPIVVFSVWYFIFRTIKKSSLMSFGCMLAFYYTGEFKNWVSDKFPGLIFGHYSILIPFLCSSLVILFFLLKKSTRVFRRTFFILNIMLLLFIAGDITQIIIAGGKNKYGITPEIEIKNSTCDSCILPDIYYIIFDAYTSSKELSSEFGYSNRPIEEYLKSKGFVIPGESKSNYNYTAFSIASVMNMGYLTKVDTLGKISDREYLHALKRVYKNRFISFLLTKNYKLYNHSIFEIDSLPPSINDIDAWNFRKLFDQYNLLIKLSRDIGYYFPEKLITIFNNEKYYVNSPINRDRLSLETFQHLLGSIKIKSEQPKFVYAHFLSTHPPYFFDSTGQAFSILPPNREAYLHQIAYSNRLMKLITDSILNRTQRPTVIIFQGDHGISFDEPVNKKEYFPNFNAIYFSNKDYGLINDSLHNVNTFRILLNVFFKQKAELLPYQSYFTKWFNDNRALNSGR